MQLTDEKGWNEAKAANDNGVMTTYSGAVIWFAEHWAECMENGLEHGRVLADIADDCSDEVDGMMGRYGLTGFQYGCAVNILVHCWKWGDDLRVWHNAKYGHEGAGVVNPAIMTIGGGN